MAPNGGETWKRGVTQSIRWTYTGAPGTSVKIQLLRYGYVVSTITSTAPIGAGGGGSYGWIASNALAAGGGYQVKVLVNAASPAVNDKSNTNFSLS